MNSRIAGTIALAMLLALPAHAQTDPRSKMRAPRAKSEELDRSKSSRRAPHDRLYFSTSEDGSPQVHGRTYKAEFTPAGASYIPFCGSAAEQNHPVTFRIDSIRAGTKRVRFSASDGATREQDIVSYVRGPLTEEYVLGVDSVEQRFVFSSRPADGDLVLRLGVSTDMTASFEGEALLFSSPDGALRYGAATVLDANGASAPLQTGFDAGEIVIRVPESFLARATFPVTIDPVISTTAVLWGTDAYDDFAPSIAWDETYQIYCIVYEETFSATDHDIVFTFEDAAGSFLGADYIDMSTGYWANPDVADSNQRDNFFVVAEVGQPGGGGGRTIHGRIVDAATGTLGAGLLISTADASGEKINPSVGSDPYDSGVVNFAVVWQRVYSPGSDEDIHYRYVSPAGALVGPGTGVIDNSAGTIDRHPRISKSCGPSGIHHVVWERELGPSDHDVYAAELDYQGTVTIASTPVVTGGDNDTAPAASTCLDASGQWLLVYEHDYGTDRDIYALLMTGVITSDGIDLSDFESNYNYGTGLYWEDQRNPAADSDGARFAVAYAESYYGPTTDYDIYLSTLEVLNGRLMLSEFHQNVAASGTHEDFPRMCATAGFGGPGWHTAVVWSDTGGTNLGDVEAALYDVDDSTKFCFPGLDSVRTCPCSNAAPLVGAGCLNSGATTASIWKFGTASLANDTAVLYTYDERPTALNVVVQSSSVIPGGVSFGQGVRCVGMPLKRLYTLNAVAGSISAPGRNDPSLHARSAMLGDSLSPGSVRCYFAYYRDPIVLGGCPSALTFNATDTVQVTWRP